MRVVADAVRSGIAALNVVTAALDADPRTRDVEVVFARGPDEVARAIARDAPTVVAWSFYSPDAARAAADLAWLRGHAPAALHVAGGVHATAEPAATVRDGFDLVIAGEGEAAFVELVAAVREGRDPRGSRPRWRGSSPAAPPTDSGGSRRGSPASWSSCGARGRRAADRAEPHTRSSGHTLPGLPGCQGAA